MSSLIIKNGFDQAFSLRLPTGELQRFGICEMDGDSKARIEERESGFFLVITETTRQSQVLIPGDAKVTTGYHDSEHGEWVTLADMAAR